MLRQIKLLVMAAAILILIPGARGAERELPPLHSGDLFPQFSAQTLTGKTLELPSTNAERPALVVFSFSRTAGKDSRAWSEHLSKDFPDIAINTIINLESVPTLFRGMALSGIKSGIPSSMQDRTVVLYRDEALWKQRLAVTDDNRAYLILLDSDGRIRWSNGEAFTDAEYSRLRSTEQTLHQSQ